MLATVADADSASTVRKKYSVFIYSEAEPHAMYAIYKQTLTLCVLQYLTRLYDRLSKCMKVVVLGPVISEKSSNENGHILPRMSGNQNVCSGRFQSMISL